ncbi:MAG: hypothetical protein VYB24_08330, partial [Pseudomonadota bacterium]|nr:hypothetical protein [Pseudomonadota bacterium]
MPEATIPQTQCGAGRCAWSTGPLTFPHSSSLVVVVLLLLPVVVVLVVVVLVIVIVALHQMAQGLHSLEAAQTEKALAVVVEALIQESITVPRGGGGTRLQQWRGRSLAARTGGLLQQWRRRSLAAR